MSLRNSVIGGDFGQSFNGRADTNERKGVYAFYPAQTPKYGGQGADGTLAEDVARLYVQIDNPDELGKFKDSVSLYSKEAGTIISPLVGTKEDTIFGYVDFFATRIDTAFAEKMQIHEVLSDNYVAYFFGQKPPTMRVSGVLMNTRQDDWSAAFYHLYDAVLRGTRMADLKQTVSLRFDRRIATGVILSFDESIDASMQMATNFSFNFLVKSYEVILEPDRVPTRTIDQMGVISQKYKQIRTDNKALITISPYTSKTSYITTVTE